MAKLSINSSKVNGFVSQEEIYKLKDEAAAANNMLHQASGKGSDFLGWLNLPSSITDAEFTDIEQTAAKLNSKADYVVVVGIGGSVITSYSIHYTKLYENWLNELNAFITHLEKN